MLREIKMIECWFCQATDTVKNNICSQCGTYQSEDVERTTDPLDPDEASTAAQPTADHGHPRSIASRLTPVAIRLKIGNRKREDFLLLTKDIYIGRHEPFLNLYPEIDLAHDGPDANTTSRRHAVITKQSDQVFIEDLGSTNGTFINGKKIDPHLREPIKSGDILRMGKLTVEVEIQDTIDGPIGQMHKKQAYQRQLILPEQLGEIKKVGNK
jgi:hypothetical protein